MNDSNADAQLITGFYALESGAWRWTAGAFGVQLRTPPGAARNGATLAVALTVPEVEIAKLKDNGLTASINGTALKSEKYDKPGAYAFSADVPASMLAGETVQVDFTVDKVMRPDGDKRDLGLIVRSVGITSK